ncbi:MAG TPA: chitobiase/beta-hexosaminidase C-terminal domain-containing protein, partial [Vicinamibacteria bacterium]|nr:chitobiase/beta-hexosaminidase C-terminal domain-containing protein [Vicinamibacteria bacterium]
GPHALRARAVDVAGNVGPTGAALNVVVDNTPLTVAVLAPANGVRVRDSVVVRVLVSEPVERVEFSVAGNTVPGVLVADRTYEATLDVTAAPEGSVPISATGFPYAGATVPATVGVVVDRTAPAPPDPTRVKAEESDAGFASVFGVSGAVEGGATVEVTNTATGAFASTTAAQDGSFATRLLAVLGTELSLVAVDSVGNRSLPTTVTVVRSAAEEGVPLANLELWVRADAGVTADAGDFVSSWSDQSDNGNDILQAATSNQPRIMRDQPDFNGWPFLRFDGSNDHLSFTNRLTTVRTVFWVVRESTSAPANYRPWLGDQAGTGNPFLGDFGAPGAIWYSGASASVRGGQTRVDGEVVDGTTRLRPRQPAIVSLVTTGPVGAANFGRNTDGGYAWFGDLAELLVYSRALSSSERQSVEDYLARKYRPYVPAVGTPSIVPAGGTFTGSTTVTLATSTPGAEIHYTLDGSEPTPGSLLYTDPFVLDRTATVKARAFLAGYDDSGTATASFLRSEESIPSLSSGLVLWLRADAGIATSGGAWVTEWADQSGSGNHARQATGVWAPRLVPDARNGLPAIRFDGNDYVQFPRLTGKVQTVFWVAAESPSATANYRPWLGDQAGTGFPFLGEFGAPGAIWYSGASPLVRNGQTWLNGRPVVGTSELRPRTLSVVSLVATGPLSANNFGLNTDGGYSWFGDLAELVIYDRALSASERLAVEDYLNGRYRIFIR